MNFLNEFAAASILSVIQVVIDEPISLTHVITLPATLVKISPNAFQTIVIAPTATAIAARPANISGKPIAAMNPPTAVAMPVNTAPILANTPVAVVAATVASVAVAAVNPNCTESSACVAAAAADIIANLSSAAANVLAAAAA